MRFSGLVASSVQDLLPLPALWNDRLPHRQVVTLSFGRKAARGRKHCIED